ncbi:hypothetical protein VIBRN418_10103 [Vibrio sp. N418]|uniref:Uncharacterized protein n=1 Tax=Vibrio scophthalmi TaxID=45658 RepID=A0A1E3WI57_9VIBR|nr:hypothetical protein VIBRN418_10103 [Vibrio sp. N418]ODS05499.1 hypothetical protein VSF3289_04640 [Vibrio scophthalmi]
MQTYLWIFIERAKDKTTPIEPLILILMKLFVAELTLPGVMNAEVLPRFLKQVRLTAKVVLEYVAYDTRNYHRAIAVKKVTPLIPPTRR